MTMRSWRRSFSDNRPLRPAAFFLFQLIDQVDQVEEAPPGAGADDRRGHGDAQMGFAGAGSANEDRIALSVQEGACGEFSNLPFIDRRIGEGERVDIFEDRELGSADAIADRAGLPMRALGPDQAGDEGIDLVAPGKTLAGNLVEAGAHAVKLQFAHGFQNLVAFHQAIFLMLS